MASGVAWHGTSKACAFFMAGEANGKSLTNKGDVRLFQDGGQIGNHQLIIMADSSRRHKKSSSAYFAVSGAFFITATTPIVASS